MKYVEIFMEGEFIQTEVTTGISTKAEEELIDLSRRHFV
jgi:hypothetical protein